MDSADESKVVRALLAASQVFVLVVCVFFWIGTSFSVGSDRQFLSLYSAAAVVLFVLTFAAVYRVMNSLSRSGKENDLDRLLLILVVFPVFMLAVARDAGSGVFIVVAGYFAGLLSSEVAFLGRTRAQRGLLEKRLTA